MSIKIYISPSTQEHNAYASSAGNTEEYWMNLLAEGVMKDLSAYSGLLIDMGHGSMTLGEMIRASNKYGADIHLALHTNAGGNGKARGAEAYALTTTDAFATTIYKAIEKITPTADRGVKDGNHLYEIKNSQADHKCLLEIDFHDNPAGATWISQNLNRIRTALVEAIIKFVEEEYNTKISKKTSGTAIPIEDKALNALIASLEGVVLTDTATWKKVLQGQQMADPKYLRVIFTRVQALITEYNIPKKL